MKTIIAAVISLACLMGAPVVHAVPEFQSGFNHGVSDAWIPNDPSRGYIGAYINQTGKGFEHHSAAFIEGYTRGWCEVKGNISRLYPHADDKLAPDFRCSDVLGMSLIFSLGDNKK